MIKVLGICSSPRKGMTEESLEYAMRVFSEFEDIEYTSYMLRGKDVRPCIHCNRCFKEKRLDCPVYDDAMTELYPLVKEADVLVLASPVYNMAPNAQMMAVLNRLRPLAKLMSQGDWARKVGISIAVGGVRNGGQETTLETLNNAILSFGMNSVSAGVLAYNGAAIWSGAEEKDETGLESLKFLSRRAYWMAKMIQSAEEGHPEWLDFQLAGFADEQERSERMQRFRNNH